MEKANKLGIWMDHSNAHLMEYSIETIDLMTIESKFTPEEKKLSATKGESFVQNKEKQMLSEYYKKIGEFIRNYDNVLIFGPTDAKTELFNILKENHLFSEIKIEIRQTDNMNKTEQHNFIKDYFSLA